MLHEQGPLDLMTSQPAATPEREKLLKLTRVSGEISWKATDKLVKGVYCEFSSSSKSHIRAGSLENQEIVTPA
jgi:hypothetical protein